MMDGAVSESCGVNWLQPVSRFVSVRVEVCAVLGSSVLFWGVLGGWRSSGLGGLCPGQQGEAGGGVKCLIGWVALHGLEQAVVWLAEGSLRTVRAVALLVCCVFRDLFHP